MHGRSWVWRSIGLLALLIGPGSAARTEELRLPVTRDLWVSEVGEEGDGNNGGAAQLKLKSYQEFSLIDIDPEPLRGRVIVKASLHVRRRGDELLRRVTVGTVSAEWVEGTGTGYEKQTGVSTFRSRKHPDTPWTVPGSDLSAVILGQGGSLWRMADASPPDADGWQVIPVDPSVLGARVAGIGHGFVLFDDTGTEWERQGDRFTIRLNPNRYVFSKDSNRGSAPYFTVELGESDRSPPSSPVDLNAEAADLPAGEAWLAWKTPADPPGGAGTVGFVVRAAGQPVPRYLIPPATIPGQTVRMHLRDLGLPAGAEIPWTVAAVDGAGNTSEVATSTARLSDRIVPELPGSAPSLPKVPAPRPRLGSAEVAIVDELDLLDPNRGPASPDAGRHLWDGQAIALQAARNEFIAFQVAVGSAEGPVEIAFDPGDPALVVQLGRFELVQAGQGPRPDPIVPLEAPARPSTASSKWRAYHVEIYVPHHARSGPREGTLTLTSAGSVLKLPVRLEVWDFTLPDFLSFLPEMNCYGLPRNERDYYRLAHKHRTVLNRVPYSQRGEVSDGCAPIWNGQTLDWSAWDDRFGPLLDGSAFADLPRAGVPIEVFYLPMHENWPSPMEGNYNGSYWADEAFPDSYRAAFVEVTRQMAKHFDARGWRQTLFHGFLNNKHNFKEQGWSRGSSPWLLDEPASFQDFWALRYFGSAFHEGVKQAGGTARMLYRVDVSRPQWQRDSLDGLMDYAVTSSALRQYPRTVFDRKQSQRQIVLEYGSANEIGSPNIQPAAWCLDAWALGCDGVIPWQTIGRRESWDEADRLSLFYPPQPEAGPNAPVIPSIRLKAFRRGQQDVEYLTLLGLVLNRPRWAIGQAARRALGLSGTREGTGLTSGEDAGTISYRSLKPADLWVLRARVGQAISGARPAPARRLIDLNTPRRDPSRLAPGHVRGHEPAGQRTAAVSPSPSAPAGPLKIAILQGPQVVRDALIDPARPTEALGQEGRSNAIAKNNAQSAFLVQFDLQSLRLQPTDRIERATLSVWVWDPSSNGSTLVRALPVSTSWEEKSATWRQPAEGKTWSSPSGFTPGQDSAADGPSAVVPPDNGTDLADPPIEVALDLTDVVRQWFAGTLPHHGVALVPIPDRSIDEGHFTRFQLFGSEFNRPEFRPRLKVEWRP